MLQTCKEFWFSLQCFYLAKVVIITTMSSESLEGERQPQFGDFVTASRVDKNDAIQGVYVKNNGDGTVVVENEIQGEVRQFSCKGPGGMHVVSERNVWNPNTKKFIERRRKELGL